MPTSTTSRPESAPKRGTRRQAPPSTLILLVRHGTTPTTGKVLPGRAPGLHLSDAGREQAARAAERLGTWADRRPADSPQGRTSRTRPRKDRPRLEVTAVYASPLERTQETAAPIAERFGTAIRTHAGLLECDFGEWTGAELKELARKPEWSTVQRYPSGFRFPAGESFTEMQARIVTALGQIRADHPGQAVIAVSHADPIKAAVADALGSHLDLFQRIVISPCSITAISYGAVGPTVLAVNSTGDLSELVPS